MKFCEIQNPYAVKMAPIKESQSILIPDIVNPNIPNRNGFITIFSGSGGSGKTSLMLGMFKEKSMYRGKFHHIYYVCPSASFLSVEKHPFEKHDKVFHELTVDLLRSVYDDCVAIKDRAEARKEKRKKKEIEKKKNHKKQDTYDGDVYVSSEEEDDEDDEDDIQYSCLIIDDFADSLKQKDIQQELSRILIKARHLCLSVIFTLQSYYYMPKILRKQVTNVILFKPKNVEEWASFSKEILKFNKDDALRIYDYVFDVPYNHLDVNTVEGTIYKNFNLLEICN